MDLDNDAFRPMAERQCTELSPCQPPPTTSPLHAYQQKELLVSVAHYPI